MNRNNIKLLALDMDGTILNSDHHLTMPVQLALQRVAKQGRPVILTSARSPASMLSFIRRLDLREMFIALNGALILGQDQTPLHHTTMTATEVKTVLALCDRYGLTPNLFAGFKWYVKQTTAMIERQIKIVKFAPVIGHFSKDILGTIEKILVMGDLAAMRVFYNQLQVDSPNLNAAFSKPTYCEITGGGVSKATALSYVCRRLKIPPPAVLAIGDNFNDVAMLEFAGYGVAMGNAPAAVQHLADKVIGPNDEDGVADFIRQEFLCTDEISL